MGAVRAASGNARLPFFYAKLISAYILFVGGSALFGLVVCPFVLGLRKTTRVRRRRMLASRGARLYLWVLSKLGLLNCTMGDVSRLPSTPSVIVANHPTLFDAVLLLSLKEDAACLAKRKLRRHFAFGPAIYFLGYLTADKAEHLLEGAKQALRQGASLIVFPEGSRSSRHGKVDAFHRGAASISIRTGAPLIPVVIRSNVEVLGRNKGLLCSTPCLHEVLLEVKEPMHGPSKKFKLEEVPGLVRDLTSELEMRYSTWLSSSNSRHVCPAPLPVSSMSFESL